MGGGTSGWVGSEEEADEENKWQQTSIHLLFDRQVETEFVNDKMCRPHPES